MPIALVAIAEIALAMIAAIWLTVRQGIDEPVVCALVVLGLAVLNACGILRFATHAGRRRLLAGLWLIAIGGLSLSAIGSNGLWSDWVIPPATSWVEILAPLDQLVRIAEVLVSVAALCLLAGWGLVFADCWKRRRRA
ncbi:hypothetical protein ACQKOH_21180 [Sphingomonas sp. NPDC092331]|jgi:hypothetical protein|uniref:hypothetical protein n=1 Tax=unclassified Sphingomonas TaxID=196159 RepID=UPI0031F53930